MRQWALGTRKKIATAGLAAGVLAASNVICAQIPCAYEVTAIIQVPECPPFGFPPTIGMGISEPIDGGLPYVVGHVQSCVIGPDVAFLWTPDQGIQLIPTPPGTLSSEAADIEGTRIVGNFNLEDDGLSGLGFLYDYEANEFTNLGTLPGGTRSEALAVNAAGQIAGYWGNHVIGPWQTFMWEDGVMNDLGPSIGGANNRGLDMNDNGAITGWMGNAPIIKSNAFIWDQGKVTVLPFIPGGFTSQGRAINSLQQVTGEGNIVLPASGFVVRSFLWSDGKMSDLGTLPGTTFTRARGISDQGVIVGYCHNSGLTDQTAFVWEDGVMMALNDLIPPELGLNIMLALAINQAGQITGQAISQEALVAFVLTPIEPRLGDLDGDCAVGTSDLLILLADWGPCKGCPSDLDGNGSVGVSDLLILLSNWG